MKKMLLLMALAAIILSGCNTTRKLNKEYTTDSGLKYVITHKGKGRKAEPGEIVKVHYTGKLSNDTVFDSSIERGKPFEFVLGQGKVIKGWDEGIAFLVEGDKATLTIPSDLGYGERDMGIIPPNSTLIFDVELMEVKPGAKPFNVMGKETKTTENNVKYIIIKHGNGPQLQEGMRVTLDYTAFLKDGMKKFDSSVDNGAPITLEVGEKRIIPGWSEGLKQLHVGDTARIIIPYDMAYGEIGMDPFIPPKADIVFDVQIHHAEMKEQLKPFNVKGLDTITTASGLKYIMVEKKTGKEPKSGDKISVHYTGYFLDGKIFDSSVQRGQTFDFTVGQGQVIKGWDEALMLLKPGEKARLIIPPYLGYGDQDRGPIPANSTLIFDVELVKIW